MKKSFILTLIWLCVANTFAQSPDLFGYQAVVRDNSGKVIASKAVSLRFSILQTTATGTAQYVETHNPTTDANGLVSLMIGGGTVSSGSFTAIDWATDKYFLKVELDPAGGSSYSNMGTTQLISVPYAKHAETAMHALNDSVKDADADSTNELQTLSISNDTIFLSNGGFAVIPDSSLLGVRKGGSGAGAGGSAELKDFSSNFKTVMKIGDDFEITDMIVDAQKNVYIVGHFIGECIVGGTTVSTGKTGYDVLLAKFDSTGTLLWQKHSDNGDINQNEYQGSKLALDAGNVYISFRRNNAYLVKPLKFGGSVISGTDSSQHHIMKLNQNGVLQWQSGFHVKSGNALNFRVNIAGIAVNSSGEVFYTGEATGEYVFGNQRMKISQSLNTRYLVLAKISSNGLTHTVLDTAKNGSGLGVTISPAGNPIVFGAVGVGIGSINLGNTNYSLSSTGFLVEYSSQGSLVRMTNELDYRINIGSTNTVDMLATSSGVYITGVMYNGRISNLYKNSNLFSSFAFVLKTNSNLQVTNINDLKYQSAYNCKIVINSAGNVLWGATGATSYTLNDKIKYFLGGTTATLTTTNSNLQAQKVEEISTLESSNGFIVDHIAGTTFLLSKIDGNFYNKGTKYTPGVYLFKE